MDRIAARRIVPAQVVQAQVEAQTEAEIVARDRIVFRLRDSIESVAEADVAASGSRAKAASDRFDLRASVAAHHAAPAHRVVAVHRAVAGSVLAGLDVRAVAIRGVDLVELLEDFGNRDLAEGLAVDRGAIADKVEG